MSGIKGYAIIGLSKVSVDIGIGGTGEEVLLGYSRILPQALGGLNTRHTLSGA